MGGTLIERTENDEKGSRQVLKNKAESPIIILKICINRSIIKYLTDNHDLYSVSIKFGMGYRQRVNVGRSVKKKQNRL